MGRGELNKNEYSFEVTAALLLKGLAFISFAHVNVLFSNQQKRLPLGLTVVKMLS